MSFCRRCGKFIDPESNFCPFCGGKITPPSADPSLGMIYEEDFREFLGRNADTYIRKFRNFSSSGANSFAFTWNWSAFFLGFIWMLYRKMYLWALAAFFIAFTPVAFPLTMIGWGIAGNYIYFLHARRKILEYKSRRSPTPMALNLKDLGGVNHWVWLIGILLILILLIIGLMGFFIFFHFLDHAGIIRPQTVEI
jgi:hypothetical protein